MSLVVLQGAGLELGGKVIFEGLDLRIGRGERIGLLGRNGAGKSTLFRVITGEQGLDRGTLRCSRGLLIGYLAQDLEVASPESARSYVVQSVAKRGDLERRAAEITARLEAYRHGGDVAGVSPATALEGPTQDDPIALLAEELAAVHERLAGFDRDYSEHEAARILHGLGLDEALQQRAVAHLSGGFRMRVHLAALLFRRPDLLLLDEPTNHLDLPASAWLAGFLRRYSESFILISHDREFLNEQVSRIVSFEVEGVRQYRGDVEGYLAQREQELMVLRSRAKNLAREREQAERFIERFRAQANKAKAVQSRVKALEKQDEVQDLDSRRKLRIVFPEVARAGAVVLRAEGIAKAFGERSVLRGVDFHIGRGEKIGIVGPNGAGKTTLLRILSRELLPDAGTITWGSNVTVGYYAQHHADVLSPSDTVLEAVTREDPLAPQTRVRTLLGAFEFSGEAVEKRLGVLSGGERARVALAKLLIRPANVVLLDEPTNHLDLESSELLAEALRDFGGTLVFVSHNRSFLRRVATTYWNVEGGGVVPYRGTLDEYLAWYASREDDRTEAPASGARAGRPTAGGPAVGGPAAKDSADREDRRSQRRAEAERRALRARKLSPFHARVKGLEDDIDRIERAQSEREAKMAEPGASGSQVAEWAREHAAARTRLQELMAAWETAAAELAAAEAAFDAEG